MSLSHKNALALQRVTWLRTWLFRVAGELRIIAHLPQGDVEINQFDDIRKQKPADTTA
jgi:hypothetical protein